ncbi:Arabinonate dehydratase [Durusdinium trenchii]|uniref:Arabinonate dehydratase n=1 Tax=Durusdinium trenchii TaxID=1381693 RepID=A0ABP0QA28_9DINO
MARIASLQVFALRGPKIARPHWTAFFPVPPGNEILVRLRTTEGLEGFGLASSYTAIEPLVKPWQNGFAELILGEDALAPERIYQKIFKHTANKLASERGWSREAMIRLSAAVDLACWDIVGKAANLPLYKLFGGFKDEVACYATCGYYREGKDEQELRDDLQMMVEQGHKGFKVKIGGLSLSEDMERLRVIREVIGDAADLMVDVNRAWDFRTACEGVKLLEAFRPRWLEEPVAWEEPVMGKKHRDDRRLLKLLAQRTSIPLSGGESEFTSYGCRALLEVVGQPVYGSGQPVYGNPDMIGSSLYGGNYGWGDSRPPTADERGAGTGWMLYALGCFLCLCFGPVGPLFWFVVAGMHYCKPQSVRDTLPQEAAVARVSLMTAVASTCAMVALFMLLIFVVAPNAQFQGPFTCEEPCRDWSRASSPQDLYVCLDMYTKRCAAPSRNRCYNGEVHCRQKGASSDCPQSCSSFAGFASKWDQYVCFNNATAVCTEATNTGCMSAELRCRPMP